MKGEGDWIRVELTVSTGCTSLAVSFERGAKVHVTSFVGGNMLVILEFICFSLSMLLKKL
ncbi:hypothetical protein BA187_11820 [Serratia marcescens]|nr:hypothetical protein BA187_11820 [Serratia marcescens]